ncbi:MAG: 30S ribosomal protein S12 methylthiotransferase RimO [Clostridiales bacterium]|nr:30S ribosomal protein S12 methylthiotransferase RimO [Clostridiales bacterium]
MKSVAAISLGCDKNRVDTERMLYRISRGGYGISDVSDAEVIIVNTCAFIESAREESIDTILSCAELKKSGKCERLIVTGCLPQRYLSELKAELPEVDAFLGVNDYEGIVEVIDGSDAKPADFDRFEALESCGRLLTTYPHLAYLKIADGCDNKCTFCAIPSIRGPYRSRPIDGLVKEAEGLVEGGVKELVLVAQDVTRYGEDKGSSLIELLAELKELSVEKIRLLYCYPERVSDELIEFISTCDKMAKYIDIPVQHYSAGILKLMNRKTTGEAVESLIAKLHARGIAVRTTLMVGFPGESEEDFAALCEFVKRARPEYAGVFAYSKEEGTAAARLKGHIAKSVKRKRADTLGRICTEVTRDFNKNQVGRTLKVIYEDIDYDKNLFVGRADFQAPDVDGRVYFKAHGALVGKYYDVKITYSDDYDLYGEAIDELTE